MRSKLRHPIRSIREPFGTAGLVVACIALIAALGGSAIAAGKLTSKQKKEVEKIAKKYAGKPGAPGAAGPAGPAGAPGAKGDAGAAGTNGTSVTVTGFNGTKGTCTEEQGGLEVQSASPTAYVCNGKDGSFGDSTMTGFWGTGTILSGFDFKPVIISFPASMKATPKVVWLKPDGESFFGDESKCEGSYTEPIAEAGYLCVYTGYIKGLKTDAGFATPLDPSQSVGEASIQHATEFGMVNAILLEASGNFSELSMAYGSWAATPAS